MHLRQEDDLDLRLQGRRCDVLVRTQRLRVQVVRQVIGDHKVRLRRRRHQVHVQVGRVRLWTGLRKGDRQDNVQLRRIRRGLQLRARALRVRGLLRGEEGRRFGQGKVPQGGQVLLRFGLRLWCELLVPGQGVSVCRA